MNLGGIDTRQWWIGVVLFGATFLVAAIAAKDRDLIVLALGVSAFGVGEWRNHPLQTQFGPGVTITSHPRRSSLFGTLLDLIGLGLIAYGAYHFFRSG